VLAGLSGAAFAFTENILYYGRVYRYAARTFGEVPPLEALQDLFVVRGLMTFFGHPLFTAMTGIGLAVALRSKSKIVRVVAPLAGYCIASFLHMAFNAAATLMSGTSLLFIYLGVALPVVLGMIIFVVRQLRREGRLIRDRLTDYVRVGWVAPDDPQALSRLRTRTRAVWHATFLGPDTFLATIRLQRAVTELAYLRDAITRGIVDQTGLQREKTLLAKIKALRGQAIVQPEGRAAYPSFRRQPATSPAYAPPSFPGPAGIGGNYPAPTAFPAPTGAPASVPAPASAPLGQTATQYSEVDPSWKPPGE
jgi:protease PrsW